MRPCMNNQQLESTIIIDTSKISPIVVKIRVEGNTHELSSTQGDYRAQNVLIIIDQGLQKLGMSITNIKSIEVHTGPGESYTGLRIGAAIANVFAWYLNIPVNGKNESIYPVYSN